MSTGDQVIGGMPFRIARGSQAVVAVQAHPRPGTDVVRQVTIPVGQRLEVLHVLHATAFLSAEHKMCYDILVKYRNGSTTTCQFWPFSDSVVDWLTVPLKAPGSQTWVYSEQTLGTTHVT